VSPTTIIVVDDHPVVLHGLVNLLSEDKCFKILATCRSGFEAIDAVKKHLPDLALLDLNMPQPNGLGVLDAVNAARLATRVIFLAASPTDHQIVAAHERGAFGMMRKEGAADELISCLHAAAAGEKWFSPELLRSALERTREHRAQIAKVEHLLTRREIEVMLLVANGLSNKDVANQLNISEGTIKIHLNNIYHKTGINNRTALANFAIAYRDKLMTNELS
jgi:DNA-binding NarL/FixJ family response regulator